MRPRSSSTRSPTEPSGRRPTRASSLEVLRKEFDTWRPRIRAIGAAERTASDVEVTWRVIEEMAAGAAALLEPIFVREAGLKGRLSIQTNPTHHADADRMLEQGRLFAALAPNMQVKFPATSAGIAAIEEATYHGISINATVSFTLPQALAVGAAVERGLDRREAAGLDITRMSPVCTLMIGRLDDWMKAVCERDDIVVDPAAPNWAGLAVFKKAAAIYTQRGYRTRLLAAAYRHHLHWSELIGGDVTLTMPHQWQRQFNESSVEVRPRFADPVPPTYVAELRRADPGLQSGVRAGRPDRDRVRYLRRDGPHASFVRRQLLGPGPGDRRHPPARPRPQGLSPTASAPAEGPTADGRSLLASREFRALLGGAPDELAGDQRVRDRRRVPDLRHHPRPPGARLARPRRGHPGPVARPVRRPLRRPARPSLDRPRDQRSE